MLTTFIPEWKNYNVTNPELIRALDKVNQQMEDRFRLRGFYHRKAWYKRTEKYYELLFDCYRGTFTDPDLKQIAERCVGGMEVEVVISAHWHLTGQDMCNFLQGMAIASVWYQQNQFQLPGNRPMFSTLS